MVVGICDDEAYIRDGIKNILMNYAYSTGEEHYIVPFTCGEEIFMFNGHIDLLFLDIEMTNSNGIDVMHSLLMSNKVWRIVFVSSHDEFVMDVFGVKTLAFVKKPFRDTDIIKWFKVVESELNQDFTITIEEAQTKRLIKASDIIYIESNGNYTDLYLRDERIITRRALNKWEEILQKGDFLRIQKSYLVNMNYIEKINSDVILKDGTMLAIGRSYKKSSISEYNDFVIEKMRNRR
ncbi:MAG: LytTR family DNA-binding domain-containing protein [Lachnospiraceae bacterium]|nr:LytTR family DNA-binding domain-containing protein [Lachnospiraceae bacterium]